MEGISRKDLDQTVEFLLANGNPELVKIADKITKMDIIPKLYVYTYVKKIRDELKQLKGDQKSIDLDEFEQLVENVDKLQLDIFKTSTEANKLLQFLENAFTREHEHCDFEDSIHFGKTKTGTCQSEYHEGENPAVTLTPTWFEDEQTHKWDDNYMEWICKACSDSLDSGDGEFNVSCDMDDGL